MLVDPEGLTGYEPHSRSPRRLSVFRLDNHLLHLIRAQKPDSHPRRYVDQGQAVAIAIGLRPFVSFEPGQRISHHCGWSPDWHYFCLSAFIRALDPSEPTTTIVRHQ